MRLGQQADLVVVAPATADLLARAAHGLADDLLTNTLLTARCPVLFAPGHAHRDVGAPGHRRQRGHAAPPRASSCSSPPSAGSPAPTPARGGCPTRPRSSRSPGRLLRRGRAGRADLAGRHVVVTAGGTREPLDPVRFLGNRSSGKQGYAFARTAAARGARVTLVAANVALPDPAGVDLVRVGTTEELRDATLEAAADADVGGDGGRAGRLPAGRRTPTGKIKKVGRRRGADARAGHQPGHRRRAGRGASAPGRCSSPSPPRPATSAVGQRPRQSWSASGPT